MAVLTTGEQQPAVCRSTAIIRQRTMDMTFLLAQLALCARVLLSTKLDGGVSWIQMDLHNSAPSMLNFSPAQLWMPLAVTAITCQLFAVSFLPSTAYTQIRRFLGIYVPFVIKAYCLITVLLIPNERPSSYFCICLPYEGAMLLWQQLVYQFPWSQSLVNVAVHCTATMLLCNLVPANAHFNAPIVLVQSVCGAVFAFMISFYHAGFLHSLDHHVLRTASPVPDASGKAGVPLGVPMDGPDAMAPATSHSSKKAAKAPAPVTPYSLKQPQGLSQLTIAEDCEFVAPEVLASYDLISKLAKQGGRNAQYVSRLPRQRLYMKIPHAEPEQLPDNFLVRLNAALEQGTDWMAVGMYARAGCIELVVEFVHKTQRHELEEAEAGQLEHHLAAGTAAAGGGMVAGGGVMEQMGAVLSSAGLMLDHATLNLLEDSAAAGAAGAAGLSGLPPDRQALHGHGEQPTQAGPSGMEYDMQLQESPAVGGLLQWLQQPHDAEVLTQACGRVFISRWDATSQQWTAEEVPMKPKDMPRVYRTWPVAILSSGPAASASLDVLVSNNQQAPCIWVRSLGRYLPCSVLDVQTGGMLGRGNSTPFQQQQLQQQYMQQLVNGAVIKLDVAGLPSSGLLIVECKMGRLLSNWKPVVVSDDPLLIAELQELEAELNIEQEEEGATSNGRSSYDDLLTDLGAWLEFTAVDPARKPHHDPAAPASLEASSLSASSTFSVPASKPSISSGGSVAAAGTAGAVGSAPSAPVLAGPSSLQRGALALHAASFPGALPGMGQSSDGSMTSSASFFAPVPVPEDATGSDDRAADGLYGLLLAPGSHSFSAEMRGMLRNPDFRMSMVDTGLQLLEFCTDRAWVHTSERILQDLLCLGYSFKYIMRHTHSNGLTLLHRAVRSQRAEMVDAVIRWGNLNGVPWSWDVVAGSPSSNRCSATGEGGADAGITPLHLAASLDDHGALAANILSEYKAAYQLWYTSADARGVTPHDCAESHGYVHLVDRLQQPSWGQPANHGNHASTDSFNGLEGRGFLRAMASTMAPGVPTLAAVTRIDSFPGNYQWARPDAFLRQQLQHQPDLQLYQGEALEAIGECLTSNHNSNHNSNNSNDNNGSTNNQLSHSSTKSSTNLARMNSTNSTAAAQLTRRGRNEKEGHNPEVADVAAPAAAEQQQQHQHARMRPRRRRSLVWQALAVSISPPPHNSPAEVEYRRYMGVRHVKLACVWHPLMALVLLSACGSLLVEGCLHLTHWLLPYCLVHLLGTCLIMCSIRHYLAVREMISIAAMVTRSASKLFLKQAVSLHLSPVAGSLVQGGMLSSVCDQVRMPYMLLLRLLETLATAVLYLRLGTSQTWNAALLKSFLWNCLGLALGVCVDVYYRAGYMASIAPPVLRHPGGQYKHN